MKLLMPDITTEQFFEYEYETEKILCRNCEIPRDERDCSGCVAFYGLRDVMIMAVEAVRKGKELVVIDDVLQEVKGDEQ